MPGTMPSRKKSGTRTRTVVRMEAIMDFITTVTTLVKSVMDRFRSAMPEIIRLASTIRPREIAMPDNMF